MASYSSTPKPRRGHRRVSGGGSVSGAEPLLVGVTTPPVVASGTSSAAGASPKKADAQRQSFSDDALRVCPQCGEETLRKRYNTVGVTFKGSGFYSTDKGNS